MNILGKTSFRLAHLSDLHLPMMDGRLDWRDMVSKRLFSRISWQMKRRHIHRPEVFQQVIADISAQCPDHVAVTGDITNLSLPDEFERSLAWLERLGAAENVTLIPGNHDRLVALRPSEGPPRWSRWMTGDDGNKEFPFVRVRGPAALIGVNTAIPTPLFRATGRAGAKQRNALRECLVNLGVRDLYRVVLIHHPIGEGRAPKRKGLDDRAEVRAVIADAGAELVLHGHNHIAEFYSVEGPRGPVPVIGVPSASAIATEHETLPGKTNHAARWHLMEIAKAAGGWRTAVTARRLTPSGKFEVCGEFMFDAPRSETSLNIAS